MPATANTVDADTRAK
jgi:hypothetical protein